MSNCSEEKPRCEGCGRRLRGGESVLCDDCYEAHIETCLASSHWMSIRGPYVADEFRAALAAIRARREYNRSEGEA